MELIDKSAVVAEIERRITTYKNVSGADRRTDALISLKTFLNTLEVKEVDLKEEIKKYIRDNICGYCVPGIEESAKHFFELGINSKLSWQDMRKIAEIGEEFMNSEESDNLSEEEYYIRILDKFKAQKSKG